MSSTGALVVGAAQLGLQSILVRPKRAIGDFTATVTLQEVHQDELEITDHPVETGASITDHAFKLPYSLVIKAGWSSSPSAQNYVQSLANAVTGTVNGAIGAANQVSAALGGPSFSSVTNNSANNIKDIYAKFIQLQEDRNPIDVYTGKRVYKNMLIKRIDEETNIDTENSLILTITLRQVILVSTSTVSLANTGIATSLAAQQAPQKTALITNSGVKQLIPTLLPSLPF